MAQIAEPQQAVIENKQEALFAKILDEITKKQTQTKYNKSWGVSPVTHKFNQRHKISQHPHLQYMDLGAVIKSLKSSIQKPANENNEDIDSEMRDKVDENELYTKAVLEFISNPNNITSSQTDLVLKFFKTAHAEQQRLEIKQQEKLAKLQQKQREKEQRESGAAMLLSIVTWLTEDAAMVIMEMKSDNIEQAIDYCMNTEQMSVYTEVKQWKDKHPKRAISNDVDIDMHKHGNYASVRSDIDKRVMNRSATTGETKAVTFRCISISDDGVMTLQAILDRNNIPLDPITAKLFFLSITDLMHYEGVRVEHEESVLCAQNERVLSIVFQVVKNNANNVYNDMYDMVSSHLSNYGGGGGGIGGGHGGVRRHRYHDKATEFVPIQFAPRCRDLEYEWEFEDKTPPNNSCLKSVKHRMDGAVLFRGIYDDGSSLHLFGSSVEQPIDIYTQILDDVTHNILCIIFENDLRDNVVVDVRNISFTEQTLEDV